jgi:hypothetical protein
MAFPKFARSLAPRFKAPMRPAWGPVFRDVRPSYCCRESSRACTSLESGEEARAEDTASWERGAGWTSEARKNMS